MRKWLNTPDTNLSSGFFLINNQPHCKVSPTLFTAAVQNTLFSNLWSSHALSQQTLGSPTAGYARAGSDACLAHGHWLEGQRQCCCWDKSTLRPGQWVADSAVGCCICALTRVCVFFFSPSLPPNSVLSVIQCLTVFTPLRKMTCSVAGIIKYSVDDMIISVCQCVVSVGFGSTLLLHLKTVDGFGNSSLLLLLLQHDRNWFCSLSKYINHS